MFRSRSRRQIGDRGTGGDRFPLGFLGGGFFSREREHFGGAVARNEANAGVVGEHDIAPAPRARRLRKLRTQPRRGIVSPTSASMDRPWFVTLTRKSRGAATKHELVAVGLDFDQIAFGEFAGKNFYC